MGQTRTFEIVVDTNMGRGKNASEFKRGSLAHKLQLVALFEEGKLRKIDVARELNVGPSAVTSMLSPENINKLKLLVASKALDSSNRQRMRLGDVPEIDKIVMLWIEKVGELFTQTKIGLSMRLIQQKALEEAKKMGNYWARRDCELLD